MVMMAFDWQQAVLSVCLLQFYCCVFPATALQIPWKNWNNNPIFDTAKLNLKPDKEVFGNPQLEKQLLNAIFEHQQQQQQQQNTIEDETTNRIERLIGQLDNTRSIPEPSIAPQIYGRWRLKYTTTKTTSSPIQRTATTRSKNLAIFQDIVVVDEHEDDEKKKKKKESGCGGRLLVKQIIQFTDNFYLTVDALASTSAYPLPELTQPRQSTGKVLGLNVLGVSLVGDEAAEDPSRPNARINFVFDEGYFDINKGWFRIPYPVPFRLPILRDWVKGWIDITYLSETMRIARGNKGSTFVLIKEIDE